MSRVFARALVAFVVCLACRCGTSGSESPADVPADVARDTPADVSGDLPADVSGDLPADVAPDATPDLPPADAYVGFTRPEAGEPVDDAEIAEVTVLYLDLLRQTRWFTVTDERVHGWPQSDAEGRYWYGTWWSGVRVLKENGHVRYLHSPDGADNNGMRSGPLLVGAVFAERLWGHHQGLVRKLVRGFTSWGLVMERSDGVDVTPMLARAAYPASITSTDDGREIRIDYDLNHPGVIEGRYDPNDPPPSLYVHNPVSPHWGDVWLKNKRSKDDVGHMYLGLAFAETLAADGGADLVADLDQARTLYAAWARRVEDDGWRVATVGEDWQVYWPDEDLAFFVQVGKAECKGMLATRLYGRGDGGTLDCGEGLSIFDEQWALKNDVNQIERSFHEAAAALADLRGQPELALAMRRGLATRLDKVMDGVDQPERPFGLSGNEDLAELVSMSANVGVPLTWRDVRFLHQRVRDAHASYLAAPDNPVYRVFDAATPDGEYAYEPGGQGLFWRYLPALLGACASPLWNPSSKPLLDCEAVQAAAL